jgi:hypothetical protein
MPVIGIILTIVVVGVVLWLVEKYVPMDSTVRYILRAVVIIILVVWLLKVFGLWQYLFTIRI